MKKIICIAFFIITGTLTSLAQTITNGLEINETAPSFSAKDQNGKKIKSASLLKKGDIILIFYRGQWCPYCTKQLKALEDSIRFITEKGATVVAVTPEKPENIIKTIEKTKAGYSILFDKGLKIMKAFGVAFKVDDATFVKYKGYGIDFDKANGENGANLPVPAVYILNKDGKIIYKYFDKDYRKRPSVTELLSYINT